jgi:hypothetical protein
MRKEMAILVCLLIGSLAAGPRVIKLADPLQGTWAINLTPNGTDANIRGVKAFPETLTFTAYMFSTKTLADHGFGPVQYDEDTRAFGPATFKCTQTSDKEGKIVWQGMTTGQDITGTIVWTKADGTVVHYDYQGNKGG